MHKTGSSSIQVSLARYAALGEQGFHYFDMGWPNHSGPLVNLFGAQPLEYHANKRRGLSEPQLQAMQASLRASLASQISKLGDKTAIISAEELSNVGMIDIGRLGDFLAPHFDDIRVFCYVRPPQGFMESQFQQRVQGGSARLSPESLWPRYRARFEPMLARFPRDQVEFRLFDPRLFPGQCVVQDFCARWGIAMAPDAVIRRNESLSRAAVAMLFEINNRRPGWGREPGTWPERQQLVVMLRGLRGPKLRLSGELTAEVIRDEGDDLRWMEEQLGAPLEMQAADADGAVQSESDLRALGSEELFAVVEFLQRISLHGHAPARPAKSKAP
jgi:hypothetical protein